jgi:hypothetical protein
MLRATFVALFLTAAVAAGAAGCQHDADATPMHPKEGELPPLPPSSGTPVGYLIDNASTLTLRDDQIKQLQDIDKSLAIRDEEIDTQLRIIEKPAEDQPPQPGQPLHLHNNAPGAQIKTTPDAAKLHNARRENDDDAIRKAFVILDPAQQTTARKLLEDRGVAMPGSQPKPDHSDEDGTPVQ